MLTIIYLLYIVIFNVKHHVNMRFKLCKCVSECAICAVKKHSGTLSAK